MSIYYIFIVFDFLLGTCWINQLKKALIIKHNNSTQQFNWLIQILIKLIDSKYNLKKEKPSWYGLIQNNVDDYLFKNLNITGVDINNNYIIYIYKFKV